MYVDIKKFSTVTDLQRISKTLGEQTLHTSLSLARGPCVGVPELDSCGICSGEDSPQIPPFRRFLSFSLSPGMRASSAELLQHFQPVFCVNQHLQFLPSRFESAVPFRSGIPIPPGISQTREERTRISGSSHRFRSTWRPAQSSNHPGIPTTPSAGC